MNVRELRKALRGMPGGAEVRSLWDGATRSDVDRVWLSKEGVVVLTSAYEMPMYERDQAVGEVTVTPGWMEREPSID